MIEDDVKVFEFAGIRFIAIDGLPDDKAVVVDPVSKQWVGIINLEDASHDA